MLKYDKTFLKDSYGNCCHRDKASLQSVITAVSSPSFSPFSKQIKIVLIFLLNLNLRKFKRVRNHLIEWTLCYQLEWWRKCMTTIVADSNEAEINFTEYKGICPQSKLISSFPHSVWCNSFLPSLWKFSFPECLT